MGSRRLFVGRSVAILAIASLLAAGSVSGTTVEPAEAAPYIRCDVPKYSGKKSAYTKCHAASNGYVRLKIQCAVGPNIVTNTKYTKWKRITPATSPVKLSFTAGSYCQGVLEVWRITPKIK